MNRRRAGRGQACVGHRNGDGSGSTVPGFLAEIFAQSPPFLGRSTNEGMAARPGIFPSRSLDRRISKVVYMRSTPDIAHGQV